MIPRQPALRTVLKRRNMQDYKGIYFHAVYSLVRLDFCSDFQFHLDALITIIVETNRNLQATLKNLKATRP